MGMSDDLLKKAEEVLEANLDLARGWAASARFLGPDSGGYIECLARTVAVLRHPAQPDTQTGADDE